MRRKVVVDSGVLVALFDAHDAHHARALDFMRSFRGELLTNVAVLTEVLHLLDFSVRAQRDLLSWVRAGGVTLSPLPDEDLDRIAELLEKYADLPADFADLSLVVLCERLGIREVATVDRDFEIYRVRGGKALRNAFFGR